MTAGCAASMSNYIRPELPSFEGGIVICKIIIAWYYVFQSAELHAFQLVFTFSEKATFFFLIRNQSKDIFTGNKLAIV